MVDFGADVSCTPDLDPFFRIQSGPIVLAQALVRRFSTESLFYVNGYGLDLRQILSGKVTDQVVYTLKQTIQSQCLLDPRVQGANAALSFTNKVLTIVILVTTQNGPFTMVVTADAVDIKLIGVN